MFAAVGLFVVLLAAILVIAYLRFRNPPTRTGPEVRPPAAILLQPDAAATPLAGALRASTASPTLPAV